MFVRTRWLLPVLLSLAACATNGAGPPQESRATLTRVSTQDQDFAIQAATDDLFAVQSAQMAADHARRPAVRAFARSMAEGRTASLQKLTALAAQSGVTLPSSPDPKQQKTLAALETNRAGFDAAYVTAQQDAQRRAIEAYEAEYVAGRDPALKAFAQATLPALKTELAAAQRLHGGRWP